MCNFRARNPIPPQRPAAFRTFCGKHLKSFSENMQLYGEVCHVSLKQELHHMVSAGRGSGNMFLPVKFVSSLTDAAAALTRSKALRTLMIIWRVQEVLRWICVCSSARGRSLTEVRERRGGASVTVCSVWLLDLAPFEDGYSGLIGKTKPATKC